MENSMHIFDMFFGGGGGRQQTKVRDTIHQLPVTLEQLYNGCTKKLKLKRRVLCKECDGKGGGNVNKCLVCKGTGSEYINQQLGPNIIQRVERSCSNCRGEGEIIKNPCNTCKGKKKVILFLN